MLRKTSEIIGYELKARDGQTGKLKDIYIDDQDWTIRYLVVDTSWLPGNKVLISSQDIEKKVSAEDILPVSLTVEQVKNSPKFDSVMPVSKRMKLDEQMRKMGVSKDEEVQENPHLRDIKELKGYHIDASDGEIGHVEDFIVDSEDWVIRYIVVDTKNWLPGKKVLISPIWTEDVEWKNKHIRVNLTRENIEKSPEFDPKIPIDREYETKLHEHYAQTKYWE